MSSNRMVDPSRVQEFRLRHSHAAKASSRSGSGVGAPDGTHDLSAIEKEAFEKGFQSGERAGLQMAERKVEAVLRRFAQSLNRLDSLHREVTAGIERDLVLLALEIAKKIVHREIQADEKVISMMARVALETLNSSGKVTLYLNPYDYEIIEKAMPAAEEEGQQRVTLKVKKDLGRGDCLVESDAGNVDARISEQFKEIEKALLSGFNS